MGPTSYPPEFEVNPKFPPRRMTRLGSLTGGLTCIAVGLLFHAYGPPRIQLSGVVGAFYVAGVVGLLAAFLRPARYKEPTRKERKKIAEAEQYQRDVLNAEGEDWDLHHK